MWCLGVIRGTLVMVYFAILVHNSQKFPHCSSRHFNHWFSYHHHHFLADLGYFPFPTLHHMWFYHHFLHLQLEYYLWSSSNITYHCRFNLISLNQMQIMKQISQLLTRISHSVPLSFSWCPLGTKWVLIFSSKLLLL